MKKFEKDYVLTESDVAEIEAEAKEAEELRKKLEAKPSEWAGVARDITAVAATAAIISAAVIVVRRLSAPAAHPLPAVEAAVGEVPPVA